MPRFAPFAALRYTSAAAPTTAGGGTLELSQVLSPPYDVISDAGRLALEATDPHNSVRLDYPRDEDGHDRYALAAERLAAWQAAGVLGVDPAPTFSIYRMTATGPDGRVHRTTGVFGALQLEPPGVGDILPHEETTAKDKADRLNLLRACRANLSPIWGLSLADGLSAACAPDGPPDAVATDDEGVRHELWVVRDAERLAQIEATVGRAPVVIADGHHRFETALAYQAEGGVPGCDSVLCFVVELSEDELDVRPIHRIVSGVPAGTDVVAALAPWFEVAGAETFDASLVRRIVDAGALALLTADGVVLLRPKDGAFGPEVDLDSRRSRIALDAAFPAATVRFHHDPATVAAAAAEGDGSFGLLLRPATVAQIEQVAHDRSRMPPKTTFFWPKPRTGMVFRPLLPSA